MDGCDVVRMSVISRENLETLQLAEFVQRCDTQPAVSNGGHCVNSPAPVLENTPALVIARLQVQVCLSQEPALVSVHWSSVAPGAPSATAQQAGTRRHPQPSLPGELFSQTDTEQLPASHPGSTFMSNPCK